MSRSNTIDLVGSSVFVDEDYPDRFLPDLLWELQFVGDSPMKPEFLSDFLNSATGRRLLQSAAMGTSGSMKKLSMKRLRRLRVPAIAPGVQARWLEAKSSLEKRERALERLVALKRAFKRGLAQELLTGRRRVPEFAAKSWEEAPLGALFLERNESDAAGLPLLAVTSDRGIIPRREVGRKDSSNEDKSKYKRVRPGDIAYNTMRMWQGVSALSAFEGIVSPAYTVVRPAGGMRAEYAKHLFKLPRQVHAFLRRSQGLVDDTLNLKYPQFAKVPAFYPLDPGEQTAIAGALDLLDTEIAFLGRYLDQLKTLKRGLMQRLLSGQRAVPQRFETDD